MTRAVGRWLLCLNATALAAALGLAATGSRRALVLAALVPLVLAPFSYARWRLHRLLARALAGVPGAPAALAVTGALLDVVLVAQLLTARLPDPVPVLQAPGVAWVGPVWFSAHVLLLLGTGAVGLVRLARRLLRRMAPAGGDADPASPERREFLQRVAVAGAAVPFAASVSGVSLSYDFRVHEREIVLPGWPRALDGLRVVHLSDIHVGGGMNRERLRRVAELTNRAQPDLVAHTGDFLTHRSGNFDEPLYEALSRVRAPLGQWACLGNHDYDDAPRLVRNLAAAGVTTLRDRTARIVVAGQEVELVGFDFLFGPVSRQAVYARLLRGWGPRDGAARLLLNHDPSAFGALPEGAADLVLSGHTHGGHVGVQLGPSAAVTVVGLVGLPDQGLFARDPMRLFVTRCVGFYGYPMRVGIPPEIAVLVLRAPGPDRPPTPARLV